MGYHPGLRCGRPLGLGRLLRMRRGQGIRLVAAGACAEAARSGGLRRLGPIGLRFTQLQQRQSQRRVLCVRGRLCRQLPGVGGLIWRGLRCLQGELVVYDTSRLWPGLEGGVGHHRGLRSRRLVGFGRVLRVRRGRCVPGLSVADHHHNAVASGTHPGQHGIVHRIATGRPAGGRGEGSVRRVVQGDDLGDVQLADRLDLGVSVFGLAADVWVRPPPVSDARSAGGRGHRALATCRRGPAAAELWHRDCQLRVADAGERYPDPRGHRSRAGGVEGARRRRDARAGDRGPQGEGWR
mmetsp:Transcript_73584/g.213127  ORF Transcript_73584/g.213127 Transcript_73584/m.213127 type:complete len:295 (-) Transcript_73584:701-1585(-)